jgi:hypothetical protein
MLVLNHVHTPRCFRNDAVANSDDKHSPPPSQSSIFNSNLANPVSRSSAQDSQLLYVRASFASPQRYLSNAHCLFADFVKIGSIWLVARHNRDLQNGMSLNYQRYSRTLLISIPYTVSIRVSLIPSLSSSALQPPRRLRAVLLRPQSAASRY